MCIQECASYGELVRYLRDRCIERMAEMDPAGGKDAAKAWADRETRDWFFTPQKDLHGDAPRDVIWREQKGKSNIVLRDHEHEMFFDDCPVCQAVKEDLEGKWHWGYDGGGLPLIAEYDPEGWDARWAEDIVTSEDSREEYRNTAAENYNGIDPGPPNVNPLDWSNN